jgi:hypothetical protein
MRTVKALGRTMNFPVNLRFRSDDPSVVRILRRRTGGRGSCFLVDTGSEPLVPACQCLVSRIYRTSAVAPIQPMIDEKKGR